MTPVIQDPAASQSCRWSQLWSVSPRTCNLSKPASVRADLYVSIDLQPVIGRSLDLGASIRFQPLKAVISCSLELGAPLDLQRLTALISRFLCVSYEPDSQGHGAVDDNKTCMVPLEAGLQRAM